MSQESPHQPIARATGGAKSPRRSAGRVFGPIAGKALAYLALIAVSVATLLPLVWSVASSFVPLNDIYKYAVPFSWHAFLPSNFTLQAYQDLWASNYPRSLFNTVLVCAVTVVAGIAINSLAGFAFAIFTFPGKRVLFILVLITFLVPFEVLALPLFVIINTLHLDNSYQALILPALANGIVVFLFRQFFMDTPRELLEAARIDGLGWFGVYMRIVIPISTPVMVSAGLVLFLSQWQAFFWPLLVTNSPNYQMVQVALSNFSGQYVTKWNDIFAGSVIATIVPLVLLLALQRHYVRTIARTGLTD